MAARKKQTKATYVTPEALKARRKIKSFEVEGLGPDDGPGEFFYQKFTAGQILEIMEEHERKDRPTSEVMRHNLRLLSEKLKTPEGAQYAKEEEFLNVFSSDEVTAIVQAMMADAAGSAERGGNASSGAEDSASGTPSPAN